MCTLLYEYIEKIGKAGCKKWGRFATDSVNTGVRVSVEDKDVEVTANYYTVTFYDGSTAYGNSTPQAMQTVLSGKTAREPAAPSKQGYTFNRWMTTNNGSEAFNFNVPIEVYATMAMIAGLTYLLLYFADRKSGMTEERKQELVSSMISWATMSNRPKKFHAAINEKTG